jgi:hypothetical protein
LLIASEVVRDIMETGEWNWYKRNILNEGIAALCSR